MRCAWQSGQPQAAERRCAARLLQLAAEWRKARCYAAAACLARSLGNLRRRGNGYAAIAQHWQLSAD